jgi:hypothetical protein
MFELKAFLERLHQIDDRALRGCLTVVILLALLFSLDQPLDLPVVGIVKFAECEFPGQVLDKAFCHVELFP